MQAIKPIVIFVTIYATHACMLMTVTCFVLVSVHVLVFACFDRHERGDCLELFLGCPLHCKPWPWQVLLLATHSVYIMALRETSYARHIHYLHMQLVGHEQLAPRCNSSDGSSRQQLQLICNIFVAQVTIKFPFCSGHTEGSTLSPCL